MNRKYDINRNVIIMSTCIEENPVLEFFKKEENKNKNYSANTLSKKMNISRRTIWHHKNNSDHLVSVPPLEVGSNARRLYVIKYIENPSQYKNKERDRLQFYR